MLGCGNKTIKIIDMKNEKVEKSFSGRNLEVCCVKLINLKKFGLCLVSHGFENDGIKLWKIEA